MAHPYASGAKGSSKTKLAAMCGKAAGGSVYGGGSQQKTYARGGGCIEMAVKGSKSSSRGDKYARGGRAKSKIDINIVLPQASASGIPPHPQAGMGDPTARPGLTPVGPEPGGGPIPGMAKGGRIRMTGGAEGGLGRLQKAKSAKRAQNA